jgi:hypothetical protein
VLVVVASAVVACGIDRPVPPPGNQLLFGIGTELDAASEKRLTKEAPVAILTSWYSRPKDLEFMSSWEHTRVPAAYAAGHALHLIVWVKGAEVEFTTKHGLACGRRYPFSARFLNDMKSLAQIYGGEASDPPLFVTLFTEFQTFPCTDNAWDPTPQTNAYLRALKDKYVDARQVFKDNAPNAKVCLGWGGWQARWDTPSIGGGRSMFGHFDDVMSQSDFQCFQAMESDSNVDDVEAMTERLGRHGPVMVAHYKPDDEIQATFDADVAAMFTDEYLASVKAKGLFAFSFMDDHHMADEAAYQAVKDAVTEYGAMP